MREGARRRATRLEIRRIALMLLVAAGVCGPLAYAHLAGIGPAPLLLADLGTISPGR